MLFLHASKADVLNLFDVEDLAVVRPFGQVIHRRGPSVVAVAAVSCYPLVARPVDKTRFLPL